MSRPKKRDIPVEKMPKPPWRSGDVVVIEFLGAKKTATVIELTRHPQHVDRWIYKLKDVHDFTTYTYVGVNGSEKFSNINSKLTNDLK